MTIYSFDVRLIHLFKKYSEPISRLAIFIIFFWFGILKVLGFSPAGGLVRDLLSATMPFMQPETFMVLFGLFEMLIGLLFLVRGLERVVIPLLAFHMITTIMPLFLLTSVTWTHPFIPTLEGQYIIKNLVIIAAAIGIAAHLHPLKKNS
ncbi:MAG: hypothetical protein WCQ60_00955 [bacterium]